MNILNPLLAFLFYSVYYTYKYFGIILMCVLGVVIIATWIDFFIHRGNYKVILKPNFSNISKEQIKNMSDREFEIFCDYLFKKLDKYNTVELTEETCDGGKHLILTDFEDNKIYVECNPYDKNNEDKKRVIGRVICQKLIGSMASDDIKKGIIITTGIVIQNAWDYIRNLEQNSDFIIDIITLDEIMPMLNSIENFDYQDTLEEQYRENYKIVFKPNFFNISKEQIENMSGREFEIFCDYLFKKLDKYKTVELTKETCDGGKDLILTDFEDNKIYVECKRYNKETTNEEFYINRHICQKLIGSMASDHVKKGIIITTGIVHQNAWDYTRNLKQNSDFIIDIITLDGIMDMLSSIENFDHQDTLKEQLGN